MKPTPFNKLAIVTLFSIFLSRQLNQRSFNGSRRVISGTKLLKESRQCRSISSGGKTCRSSRLLHPELQPAITGADSPAAGLARLCFGNSSCSPRNMGPSRLEIYDCSLDVGGACVAGDFFHGIEVRKIGVQRCGGFRRFRGNLLYFSSLSSSS
jgi:hypothetical protein